MIDRSDPQAAPAEWVAGIRLVPVIDIRGGIVVRGVAGRRAEYRPLVSRLTDSVEPVAVARAMLQATQARELYVADLDAIEERRCHADRYRKLSALGVAIWLDAGVADAAAARIIAAAGCVVVAGLETVPTAEALVQIVTEVGPDRVVFSLDLRDGRPLRTWGVDPLEVAATAGIRRVIVLDLARVGTGTGVATLERCRVIRACWPSVEVITGGGIRGPGDLPGLAAAGVQGVLVASALHDGQFRHHFRHS